MNRNRPYDNRDHRHNEEDRYDHHDRQQKRFEMEEECDEDSWRWNEVRNRARDSATRRDLMPGQVHVQGILRHSREPRLRDPEDDCLGDDAPLFEPTGDPVLDAKLSQEQAELANRLVLVVKQLSSIQGYFYFKEIIFDSTPRLPQSFHQIIFLLF